MGPLENLIDRIDALKGLDRSAAPIANAVHLATRRDGVKNLLSGNRLGHQAHPVLSNLPIGAWTMATALDYVGGQDQAKGARRLVAFGLLSAVPAAATGTADWSDSYGSDRRIGLAHGALNIVAAGVHACSWAARRQGRRKSGILLSTVGLACTTSAAYLGGHLSYARGVGVNRTAFEASVDEWTPVATVEDLELCKPIRVEAGEVPVMLVMVDDGIHALSATCTHAGGSLDQGTVVEKRSGTCVVCPLHGSAFRLEDGAVVRGPATAPEPHWQVQVDNGRISVRTAPPTALPQADEDSTSPRLRPELL